MTANTDSEFIWTMAGTLYEVDRVRKVVYHHTGKFSLEHAKRVAKGHWLTVRRTWQPDVDPHTLPAHRST